ncbi:MAG: hypothetical protein IJY26_00180 [Clostridia bacterium]|nr:hypothetical protein [Clostridia bacterium]
MQEERKDNIENAEQLSQTPPTEQGAAAQEKDGSAVTADLGKFKSVDALLRAYNSLQAEFTRRSQRLKELEKDQAQNTPSLAEEPVPMPKKNASAPTSEPEKAPEAEQELYLRANASAVVKEKIIHDYLDELKKSAVPLMGNGVSVVSPAIKAKSFAEAGAMALGYFKNTH